MHQKCKDTFLVISTTLYIKSAAVMFKDWWPVLNYPNGKDAAHV